MILRNPSTVGDSFYPGQDEPEIADGVHGIWFDLPDQIAIPLVISKEPGMGHVSRMLDGLPKDRQVVFSTVMSPILEGMLLRRGFEKREMVDVEFDEPYEALVRDAT